LEIGLKKSTCIIVFTGYYISMLYFKPTLLTKWNGRVDGVRWVQPKVDGLRCNAVKRGGRVVLLSRAGNVFDLPHLSDALDWLPSDVVLDGELYCHGNDVSEILSMVRRGDRRVEFIAFDCILFSNREAAFVDRLEYLQGIEWSEGTGRVFTVGVDSPETVESFFVRFLSAGFEGAVIRDNSSYKFGRSQSVQKYKKFEDSEFRVIGFEEAKGKLSGCAVWVCENESGERFKCPDWGTIGERRDRFSGASDMIGKLLKVSYQELTRRGVPRHPVALGVRSAVDM
jgi:ATP-dependent DNA ligase